MLLAIDAGNTNTVFAVFDGETVRGEWRTVSGTPRTADEYAVWLTQLMALGGLRAQDITAAIVASVVPSGLFDLKTLCRRYFNCDPIVVGENATLGIRINIDRPRDVGADRLANAIAAYTLYGGPLVSVDFGTATNFDIVGRDGSFEGGIFASGVNLSLQALHMAAAKLPHIAVSRPKSVIGKGTEHAMQSGIYWGYISLVEGMVRRIEEEMGEPMTVVATGGLAPLFADGTDIFDHVDLDLTMKGLLEIYRRSTGKVA